MKFLDLNYYYVKTRDPHYVINKHQANLTYLAYLSNYMQVSAFHRIDKNECLFLEGVNYVFHKKSSLGFIDILFRYHPFVMKYQPDFILIHGLSYGFFSFALRRILNKNTVIMVQVHGYAPAPKYFKKVLYKWLSNFIDGYFFTATGNAKHWIDGKILDNEKIYEIMEGSTNFKYNPKINRNKQSFLWVGRLNKNKDPLTILNAFNDYTANSPNARLTMVYSSFELLDEVKYMIYANENLKKAVTLVGKVEHKNLETIYNQHQYFILGSHYEGSGYALVEAMACGCVPIVTKISSFEFMTNNGNCSLLFEPGDTKGLLRELMNTSKIDYLKMQSKVLEQFNRKLSFEAIAADVKNVFCSLVKKK